MGEEKMPAAVAVEGRQSEESFIAFEAPELRMLSRILCIYFFEFGFIAFLEETDPVRKSA